MDFFVGLHQPSDAEHFERSFINVNRIRKRLQRFKVKDWIMDSGAFQEISRFGGYRHSTEEYQVQVDFWRKNGNMLAAVSQDYMCEPHILKITGLSVSKHQELTISRYLDLRDRCKAYIMPVIQGYKVNEYLDHLSMYGSELSGDQWVGVGSICKRNTDPSQIRDILYAIKCERPDLRLHGFGLKLTALRHSEIRDLLYSADSMAWSYAARMSGEGGNDWRKAQEFESKINNFQL